MKSSKQIAFLFLILGLVWGSSFVGIEIIVHILPPWFSAAARIGIATAALSLMVYVRKGNLKIPAKSFWKVWGAGLLAIGIPFSFLFWSEQRVTGGVGGILNGTVPLWTSLIQFFMHQKSGKKAIDFQTLGGVLLGFVGIWVIFYPKLAAQNGSSDIAGGMGLLVMALSYAFANIFNQRILTQTKDLDMEKAVFHQHLSSFLYILILSLLTESWPSIAEISPPKVWGTIVYLGLFPSAFAFMIYFYLLKTVGAIKTAAVTYFIPVVALALDFVVQGHRPEGASIAGAILVLVALAFIRSSKTV